MVKKVIALLTSIIIFYSTNVVMGCAADLKQVWVSQPLLDNVVSLDDNLYLTLETLKDSDGTQHSRICRSTDLKNWETINLSFEAKNLYQNGDRFLIAAKDPDANSSLGLSFYESKDGYTWTKSGDDFYGEILYVCKDSNEVGLKLYSEKNGYEKNVSTTDFISFRDGTMEGTAVENASDTLRYNVVDENLIIHDYSSDEEYILDFLSASNENNICIYKSYKYLLLFDNIKNQIYSSSNLQDWEKVTGVDENFWTDKKIFNYNGNTYLIYPKVDDTAYIEHKILSSDGKTFEETSAFSFLDSYMINKDITLANAVIKDMYDFAIIHENKIWFRLDSEIFDCNGWMIADNEGNGTYYGLPQYEYNGAPSHFEIESSNKDKPAFGNIVMRMPIYPQTQMKEYGKAIWTTDDNNQTIFEHEMPGIVCDVAYHNGYYYCKYFENNSYVCATSQDAKNWTTMNIKNISGNAYIIEDYDGKIKKLNSNDDIIEIVYENNNQMFPNTFYKVDSNRNMLIGSEYLYRVDGNKVQFSTDGIYYIEFSCNMDLPTKLKLYENDKYYLFARQNSEYVGFTADTGTFYYAIEKDKFNQKISVLNNDKPPYIIYNDKILAFEQPPVIQDDRTLIPIRFLFEQMGAAVDWNGDTRTATIAQNDRTITFSIDNTTATVNGQPTQMDVPAQIVNDKTLVPLRFLSESLGYTVNWDGDNRIVTIE